MIECAVVLCDGETFSIDESWLNGNPHEPSNRTAPLMATLAESEKQLIEAALAASQGRISGASGAAARLGVPRQTLESKYQSPEYRQTLLSSKLGIAALRTPTERQLLIHRHRR